MKRRHFLIVILIVMMPAVLIAAGAQASLFAPAPGSPVTVGEGSGHLALADVNRDGKPDLLAQHLQQRMVTVHLGDGAGRFTPAPGSPIKLSYMPGDTKSGDLNGDGLPDIAVTGSDRNVVDVFLGDGTGKFSLAPGSPFQIGAPAESNLHGLHLADINADGKLDLIATGSQHNTLYTMLGNGRAGFTRGPATTFPAGEGRHSFAFGDVDGDGRLDVIVVTNNNGGLLPEPGRAIVLSGDGKGAFKKLSESVVPPSARYAMLGEMNGDGRLDLVLTCGGNEGDNQMVVMLNQGGGKFTPAASYDLGKVAFAAIATDVNRDKLNDLVVATVESVTVLLNGKGGFAPAPGSPFRAGPGAYHLTVGDVNQDGRPDVAASSFSGKTVTVLLGQ